VLKPQIYYLATLTIASPAYIPFSYTFLAGGPNSKVPHDLGPFPLMKNPEIASLGTERAGASPFPEESRQSLKRHQLSNELLSGIDKAFQDLESIPFSLESEPDSNSQCD